MLKVGDKVRWITAADFLEKRPIGTRGEVSRVGDGMLRIVWEVVPAFHNYAAETMGYLFIKEFQPGDRVVRLAPGTAYVHEGEEGSIIDCRDDRDDFAVVWDSGFGNSTEGDKYQYKDNLVAHAPPSPSGNVTSTPMLPPPPPDPPPTRLARGKCYTCAAVDSPWLKDRYTCEGCANRYR